MTTPVAWETRVDRDVSLTITQQLWFYSHLQHLAIPEV